MKEKPATTFPDGPAKPMKQKPADKGQDLAAGRGMQFHSSSGSQASLNPKKRQPKTMRYV